MKYDTIWVFAAGMRRAGSTLQYHLGAEVVENLLKGKAIGWVTWQNFNNEFKKYNGRFPYVILKVHPFIPDYSPIAKKLFEDDLAKALYIYRDLRDIATSMLQFGLFDWDYIVEKEILAVLNEYEQWTSLPENQIWIEKYEDMMKTDSLAIWLLRIADFLDVPLRTDFNAFELADRHNREAHLRIMQKQSYAENGFNKDSLLWRNHINDGMIEKYKYVLKPEQITQIENLTHDWLRERDYHVGEST